MSNGKDSTLKHLHEFYIDFELLNFDTKIDAWE